VKYRNIIHEYVVYSIRCMRWNVHKLFSLVSISVGKATLTRLS